MVPLFPDQTWIRDENAHYTVENTKEYDLINQRTWEIYKACMKYLNKSKYVLIVEDDVEIPKGTYEKFLNILESYPEVGTVVGNVTNRRNGAGEYWLDKPIIWDILVQKEYPSGKLKAQTVQLQESKKFGVEAIGSAHTGCWMTRTSLIKKLGFIWKEDGINFVDQTWGYRLNKAGYKMVVDWSVKCWHYANYGKKKVRF